MRRLLVLATLLGCGGDTSDPIDATPPPPTYAVYAHSPDTLFRLDPKTKQLTAVGLFQNCGPAVAAIDLAIDGSQNAYVTTYGGLYKVDLTTASCTHVADGIYPNSLSFVPAGALDPQKETLVGYSGAQYMRIDTVTGAVSTVGALTGGYASSGDVVSIQGGATYLTVTGNGCNDCLVEVNPKTGDVVKNWGAVGQSMVYGLAFFDGSVFGFSAQGTLFEMKLDTTLTATVIPIPNAPANLTFFGAGSTTLPTR